MTKVCQILQAMRRPMIYYFAIGTVLIFAGRSLIAQERPPSADLPSHCPLSKNTDVRVHLPFIPSLPSEVTSGIMGPLPGEFSPDPDDSKVLYGYSGPYYNTANLTGQVEIIDKSLYSWPTSTWKYSGMLSNKTHCHVRINSLRARLLGARDELLAIATTSVPVADLRPGEPSPFLLESPIAKREVKSVDWQVDYALGAVEPRLFEFEVDLQEKITMEEGGPRYFLDGIVRNAANSTVRGVRVVVAWLSLNENKLLYTESAKFRLSSDPKKTVDKLDIMSGGSEEFIFITTNPELISLIGEARVALWGVSQ